MRQRVHGRDAHDVVRKADARVPATGLSRFRKVRRFNISQISNGKHTEKDTKPYVPVATPAQSIEDLILGTTLPRASRKHETMIMGDIRSGMQKYTVDTTLATSRDRCLSVAFARNRLCRWAGMIIHKKMHIVVHIGIPSNESDARNALHK